ncbi:MAG TPA: hypothetical protein PK668_14325 [Myxococcota bacterium]|nr:hypothetical protein [Myxococcota bacterium]HRY93961.1 hypothetical protein [Myxococcota bacterium]HSA23092.1 hypothetical protein [Myxococcota bacterium]
MGAVLMAWAPALWLLAGALAAPALPAGLEVEGDFELEQLDDLGRVHTYLRLEAGQTLPIRVDGPLTLKLLVRGLGTGTLTLAVQLDEEAPQSLEKKVAAAFPVALFQAVPPGRHLVRITPAAAVRVCPLSVPGTGLGGAPLSSSVGLPEPADPAPQALPPALPQAMEEPPAGDEPPAPPGKRRGFMLAVYPEALFPLGGWSLHRYAGESVAGQLYPRDLHQFGPGVGAGLDVGYVFFEWFELSFSAHLGWLSTDEWTSFAAEHGSEIEAEAMQWSLLVNMEAMFLDLDWLHLDARLGLGYTQAWGQESVEAYRGLSYAYSFLDPSFALRGGLSAGVPLLEGLELVVMLEVWTGFPGSGHTGAGAEPYLGLSASVGLRLWPFRVGSEP